MEATQNTPTEEQRHGSAEATTEPKDNKQEPTTNTAATNNFTDEEKQLAKRYQVEPKLIRLIAEIVVEHTAEISELVSLMRGEKEQEVEQLEQKPTITTAKTATRTEHLLNREDVIAGLIGRWQKTVGALKCKARELATMVHGQTVDNSEDILSRFFEDLQREWLTVPEFLNLPEAAQEKFNELMKALHSSTEEEPQATDQAEEDVKTQEEPEQLAELCISQQTMKRLINYYKRLEPRAKLAIIALSEIRCLDGINFQIREKEGKLVELIEEEMEDVCLEVFHNEPGDVADRALGVIDQEDVWLAGVWEASRMIIQNT